MSKKNKMQSAGAACCESDTPTVCGSIRAINRAAQGLERLPRTGDFSPLARIAEEIGFEFGGAFERRLDGRQQAALMKSFSDAVSRLHNVVFDREASALFALRNEYEKWTPLTQCLCCKASRSALHRLKGKLLSLHHEAERIDAATPEAAMTMLTGALSHAVRCYEMYRVGYHWVSPQIVFGCLRVLASVAAVGKRIGFDGSGLPELKEIVGFAHEDICWFEMPDLPTGGDDEACGRFVDNGVAEMERQVRLVCGARPEPFLACLHQLACCLGTCVLESLRLRPECERRMFAALADSMEAIYTRIDSDADLVDCVLGHLTVPLGDCSGYSYPLVVERMNRLTRQCVKASSRRAKDLLPRNFCECTRLLCLACNFEWGKRWVLLDLYHDLLSDMWGRARELGGQAEAKGVC